MLDNGLNPITVSIEINVIEIVPKTQELNPFKSITLHVIEVAASEVITHAIQHNVREQEINIISIYQIE